MSEDITERRRFHRIASDKTVVVHDGETRHEGRLLDISLRGLLFEATGDWQPVPGTRVRACVSLDGPHCDIEMDGEVSHIDERRVGLLCHGMDLQSASRLRRMVELNLDDASLLERDLAHLISG